MRRQKASNIEFVRPIMAYAARSWVEALRGRRMQDEGCRMQDAGCRMQGAGQGSSTRGCQTKSVKGPEGEWGKKQELRRVGVRRVGSEKVWVRRVGGEEVAVRRVGSEEGR